MKPLYFVKWVLLGEAQEKVFSKYSLAKDYFYHLVKNIKGVMIVDLRDISGEIILHYCQNDAKGLPAKTAKGQFAITFTDFVRPQL